MKRAIKPNRWNQEKRTRKCKKFRATLLVNVREPGKYHYIYAIDKEENGLVHYLGKNRILV